MLALLAVAVAAIAVGGLLGRPVLLGYVETGSMAPTLAPGDGFVAIPAALAGPVEAGDVVTFRAERLHDGGLTTHRVVGETDRGYVTRGDANPFTDQEGREPPVREEQIVAVAWRPDGNVLAIPALGTAVTAFRDGMWTARERLARLTGTRAFLDAGGIGYAVAGVALALLALDVLVGDTDGGERTRERDRTDPGGDDARPIALLAVAAVVGSATVAMALPAGTQTYDVVSAEFESDRPLVIRQGTTASLDYHVHNPGVVPALVYLEAEDDGVAVTPGRLSLAPGARAEPTVSLSAPTETGAYRLSVTERRYLALLPEPALRALYDRHPWLPIVVIDGLVAVPTYLLVTRLVGRGRLRSRSGPSRSALARLRNRYL